jgi:hypothetical protein
MSAGLSAPSVLAPKPELFNVSTGVLDTMIKYFKPEDKARMRVKDILFVSEKRSKFENSKNTVSIILKEINLANVPNQKTFKSILEGGRFVIKLKATTLDPKANPLQMALTLPPNTFSEKASYKLLIERERKSFECAQVGIAQMTIEDYKKAQEAALKEYSVMFPTT